MKASLFSTKVSLYKSTHILFLHPHTFRRTLRKQASNKNIANGLFLFMVLKKRLTAGMCFHFEWIIFELYLHKYVLDGR